MNSLPGIAHRLHRGVSANAIGHLLLIATQLVLTPVLLRHWGVNLYGEWLTLSAATAYLSLSDFGLQAYTVNRLIQLRARNDRPAYMETLHTALLFALIVPAGLFLALVGMLATVH